MNIGEIFNFSTALFALKQGRRVARSGWNGKGMFLVLVSADGWCLSNGPVALLGTRRLPWIGMKTADDGFVPWLASQTDLLADDWVVLP